MVAMVRVSLVCAFLVSACGGGTPKAESASSEGEAAEPAAGAEGEAKGESGGKEASASGPAEVPTKCAGSGDVCTPDMGFVKKLCAGNYPGVALFMFAKDSPWTRGYLTRKTEAWNAAGGASD